MEIEKSIERAIMTKKKKNKKWLQLTYKILTILGCLMICYPFVSQIYYQYVTMQETKQFDDEKGKLADQDVEKRIELAKAYNSTLSPEKIGDPFSSRKKEEGVAEYARMLQLQEKIGYVTIPSINQKIPIRAGSSENVLQNGAGHLEGTSLPVGGVSTHTVITAHRGLPTARLFTDLDKVKVGDVFYITNIKETLAYQVDKILTVEPTDFKPILVKEGEDRATLLTCTPYMINSHRLLVQGKRIPFHEAEKKEKTKIDFFAQYKWFILLAAGLILLLLGYLLFKMLRKKGKETSLS